MLPALFFASQLYNVANMWSMSGEYMYNGDNCAGIGMLFSYHYMVRVGSPLAVQYTNNLIPTLTVQFDP